MPTLRLTLTKSKKQLIAGFPEYVYLETNTPSNIYYTLDGSTPNQLSEFYVDKIVMPRNGITIVLKAIAYTDTLISDILEEEFKTTSTFDYRTHPSTGINILDANEEIVDFLAYDINGDPAKSTTVEFEDLDLIANMRNYKGEKLDDTTITFINFSKARARAYKDIISSPNDLNFNPLAQYIIIDGSSPEAMEQQSVRIINRPHGSIGHNKKLNNFQLNSSNFTKYYINPKNNLICFYYFDSRSNRWLVSKQELEPKDGLNFSGIINSSPPSGYVFRWVDHRNTTAM